MICIEDEHVAADIPKIGILELLHEKGSLLAVRAPKVHPGSNSRLKPGSQIPIFEMPAAHLLLADLTDMLPLAVNLWNPLLLHPRTFLLYGTNRLRVYVCKIAFLNQIGIGFRPTNCVLGAFRQFEDLE